MFVCLFVWCFFKVKLTVQTPLGCRRRLKTKEEVVFAKTSLSFVELQFVLQKKKEEVNSHRGCC